MFAAKAKTKYADRRRDDLLRKIQISDLEIAEYAMRMSRTPTVKIGEVTRRLKFIATMIVLGLFGMIGGFAMIRFGPDVGEAAPFLVLVWLMSIAFFGYSLVAFAVLVISALSLQHLRAVEVQGEMVGVMSDYTWVRAVLADLYQRDPKSVEAAASRHGEHGRDNLAGLGIAK